MSTVGEMVNVLKSIQMTAGQAKMLRAHFLAPDHTITSTQLATAAGYKGYQAANLWYGNLGKAITLQLGTAPKCINGIPIWTFTLADGRRIGNGNEWEWTLWPEVAKAIEQIGLMA